MELTRRGPGLLLRDILKGKDPQIDAVVQVLAHVAPDVVLLTGIDWDYGNHALTALADALKTQGQPYEHLFALRPNSGMATTLDLDGDGRTGGPGDAQGYGRFMGHGGMAILSKLPVMAEAAQDFSALLWTDLPNALLPEMNGTPFPSAEAIAQQRLSSVGHWAVPIQTNGGQQITLLAYAANPPVFDGPEDRNGKRNHDENMLWANFLNGNFPSPAPTTPVILLGNANLDPVDGDGLHDAINTLRAHPRLQDPQPRSTGGAEAAKTQAGANENHIGDPALDTADWRDIGGPGNLRVSYVLPDSALSVIASGIFWPMPDAPLFDLLTGEDAPRHHLVWVDIEPDS